jgi:carbamoyl-phosphate synthase small subunit
MEHPALLMLDDGTCFEGEACGARGEAAGEVVFTTGMAGYQETLTDPSFLGQIVAFTSAHIGNYGVNAKDDEAPRPLAAGAVFHDLFAPPLAGPFPHWRAAQSLDGRMAKEGFSGIAGVDTRALTLHLREHGTRNGIVSGLDLDRPSLLRRARELPSMQGQDLAVRAGCAKAYRYSPPEGEAPARGDPGAADERLGQRPLNVAVIDYGVKRSILARLAGLGMRCAVCPPTATAEEILARKPDGVLLANGPGDPDPCLYAVAAIRKLLGRVPVFGICLGHQLLGLALGARTYKLPFGHHGVNHPVKDLLSGRVCITSQNHGFCVDPDTLPAGAAPTHWNLNDGTLEGLAVNDSSAFSVQFHPEASPGPGDATGLFIRFRDLLLARNA